MGNCKDCHDCDCGQKDCDFIDHDDVAPQWLKELRLQRKRLAEAAERQKVHHKPNVVPVLTVRMPKEVKCSHCDGSCEELDGSVCHVCEGYGIVKED